tara:strand:- start:741 stop:884 length:144 start_codon:yes stop_codon:yes gene_type:complete
MDAKEFLKHLLKEQSDEIKRRQRGMDIILSSLKDEKKLSKNDTNIKN